MPTCTGAFRSVVVLSPSWPRLFAPHVHSVPSVFSATVWISPAAADAQLASVPTCVGVALLSQSPTPS